MGGLSSNDTASTSADTDWEYEYDETEREHYYFTLDLTTHVPDALGQGKSLNKGQSKPKPPPAKTTEQHDEEGSGPNQLQVLDLHTLEPLIKFDQSIYSCYWNTDLGTQVYVSRPGVAQNPRRAGHVVDVIGTSQVRLVGRPVTLQRRQGVLHVASDGADVTNPIAVDEEADSEAEHAQDESTETHTPATTADPHPGQPIKIPRESLSKPSALAQASFFERLSAIKVKKGELDVIPVGGVRQYVPPANQEEIRQRALAAGAEEQAALPRSAETQPRKRPGNADQGPLGADEPPAKRVKSDTEAVLHNDVAASTMQTTDGHAENENVNQTEQSERVAAALNDQSG